jgi:cAMP-binding proteins - catabolite gene activator and regulatory subunit of cAMP-dependent protein kinases
MKPASITDPDLEVMTYLQQRRDIVDQSTILRNTDLFREISEEDLKKIAAISTSRKHKKGDVLFQEKSRGDELFIVVSGCIAINKNVAGGRKRNLGSLHSGEIFGEISLFDTEPRSADAEAIEDSEVIVVPNGKFLALLKDNFPLENLIQKKVINILCQRLRNTDEMLNEGVIWGFKMES